MRVVDLQGLIHSDRPIEVIGRIVRIRTDSADAGQRDVWLMDATGIVPLSAGLGEPAWVDVASDQPVRVQLDLQAGKAPRLIKLWSLSVCTAAHAVATLPFLETPERAQRSLRWLLSFAERLSSDSLDGFVTRVLSDSRVRATFVQARGSWQHHHREPGGLLVHTVEVMRFVMSVAAMKFPGDLRMARLCAVGALIHDLGKVIACAGGDPGPTRRPGHGRATREIVDEALVDLARRDRSSARHLGAVVGVFHPNQGFRGQAVSVVAELVRMADQISAMQLHDPSRGRFQDLDAANEWAVPQQRSCPE